MPLITIKEAEKRYGLSYETIRRLCAGNYITAIKTGAVPTWYLNYYSLEHYLEKRRNG